MKKCSICGRDKPPSEFYFQRLQCKKCFNVRSNAKRVEKIRELIRKAKSNPCLDCGNSYPYYVMDFDHTKGDKVIAVGNMKSGYSLEQVRIEIAKCEVICANCHRERTYRRNQYYHSNVH